MFEKLKKRMLERIERNSRKVNMGTDLNPNWVYLKNSGLIKEWHVIYPPVNPETNEWDTINLLFGGKSNALKTFVVGVLVVLLAFGVYQIISSYNTTLANPLVQSCIKNSGIILGNS